MFGYNRLKRRYRRFRYNNLARHPHFFVVLDMLKMPVQIGLIVLPLWLIVGFYDKHFSYEAKSRELAQQLNQDSTMRGTDNDLQVETVAIEREPAPSLAPEPQTTADAANQDNVIPADPVVNADPVLPPAASSAALETSPLDDETADTKVAEVEDIVGRLAGPGVLPVSASPADTSVAEVEIRDGNWLAKQDDNSFVIQLESSTNVEAIKETTQKVDNPQEFAIYPFKLSAQGEKVYGLSYGVYSSLAEAQAEIENIPPELRKFGTWIRKVGPLKASLIP